MLHSPLEMDGMSILRVSVRISKMTLLENASQEIMSIIIKTITFAICIRFSQKMTFLMISIGIAGQDGLSMLIL